MKHTLWLLLCASMSVHAQNLQLLGHYSYPNGVSCANLTSYWDSVHQKEYALVGTSVGLSIVDITTPTNPVQVIMVPGVTGGGAFWREVREYNGYAYVTTEEQSGLQVVNLHFLPDSAPAHYINPGGMTTSHTIFIDENGIAFVNGTDLGVGGILFLDLNADPWNPPSIGLYDRFYVHDCYAIHDTLYAAHINNGIVSVVDVSDHADCTDPSKTLATQNTPQHFSHNCWRSDDGKYLFTTDEKPSSWLTCYDVSDLNNITEVSRIQSEPGDSTIIHNTYYLNDYCISSYYTYGVTIHDVARKNNMLEVGHYDTSPNFQGDQAGGFHGAWGVWPYTHSGNIIASDIETGLWVLAPTYTRACYLEGNIFDTLCNQAINGVTVTIQGTSAFTQSNYLGNYATGVVAPGLYTITFSKPGYADVTVNNVSLSTGQLTTLNVVMQASGAGQATIQVNEAGSGNVIPFARVTIKDAADNVLAETSTDALGTLEICNLPLGNYTVWCGKWGYRTQLNALQVAGASSTLSFQLAKGYYDDFSLNFGWNVSGDASSGIWTRGEPNGTNFNGTACNPDSDILSDLSGDCFVTGNGGGQAGSDDVDNGYTTLQTPAMNLMNHADPWLHYYRWFFNGGGNGPAPNDSLTVYVTNGSNEVMIETVTVTENNWVHKSFRLFDFINTTSNMKVMFRAVDAPDGHLVEAGLDEFMIVDSGTVSLQDDVAVQSVQISPNPFSSGFVVSTGAENMMMEVFDANGRLEYVRLLPAGHIHAGESLPLGFHLVKITDRTTQQSHYRKLLKQ